MALTQKDLTISKPLSPVYVLFGKQSYLIQLIKDKIINQALTQEEKEFNLSSYNMEETPIEAAIEDAETLPFIGEKRVVVIENPYFLTSERTKSKVEHDLKQLGRYLEAPSPDAVLIFIAFYEKLDQRKKVVKQLTKIGTTYELSQLSDDLLFKLLENIALEYDANYTKEGHEQLLALVGPQLSYLANEVKKFALYCGKDRPIDKHIVNELGARSLENNVFSLVDMVMKQQTANAYQLLNDLLKQKEEPVKILALIARQIRIVYQVSLYQNEGYTQKQMAAKLKLHPYAVKIAAGQAKTFKRQDLERALSQCTEADYQMKKGSMEKTLVLELLIHKIACHK
ncbi:DNA polymerase-3 subunit delta [Scopulibacillus daqui]|uniref:DNA polymerase III subunit delta n=1 Tax=Scopulibacillus daqui TaxID=1469162 RepID=A0ABS2Q0V3_9BACL|nr:DNA polymerase III subunit delta [Scopulibacillus daqui]MBM7645818.1 DNA polymerase-3 subunit delta [Scopulibacillus daqui]